MSCWAEGEDGGPALAYWSRGSQNRPWASPGLQDCPINNGKGLVMSCLVQQLSPLKGIKGLPPSLTDAQKG